MSRHFDLVNLGWGSDTSIFFSISPVIQTCRKGIDERIHMLPMSPDRWGWERPQGGGKRMPQAMQPTAPPSCGCTPTHTTNHSQTQWAKMWGWVGMTCLYSSRTEAAVGKIQV